MAPIAGCASSPGPGERSHRDTTGDRAEPVGERVVADSRRAARAARKARRLGGRRSELGQAAHAAPLRLSRRSASAAARALCDLPSVELEFDRLLPLFVRGLYLRRGEDDLAAAIRIPAAVAAAGRSAPSRGAAGAGAATAGCADVRHGTVVPGRHGRRDGRAHRRARAAGRRRRGKARGIHRIVRSWRGVRRRRVAAGPAGQAGT